MTFNAPLDRAYEHERGEQVKCEISPQESIQLNALPKEVLSRLQTLVGTGLLGETVQQSFGEFMKWKRSDSVTTFACREHVTGDTHFFDYFSKTEDIVADARPKEYSLQHFFVVPEFRHHYDAEHLLQTIITYCKKRDIVLDSGPLVDYTSVKDMQGNVSVSPMDEAYKIGRAVWEKLVPLGLTEAATKDKDGIPTRYRMTHN